MLSGLTFSSQNFSVRATPKNRWNLKCRWCVTEKLQILPVVRQASYSLSSCLSFNNLLRLLPSLMKFSLRTASLILKNGRLEWKPINYKTKKKKKWKKSCIKLAQLERTKTVKARMQQSASMNKKQRPSINHLMVLFINDRILKTFPLFPNNKMNPAIIFTNV